jgi:hypothetical protein
MYHSQIKISKFLPSLWSHADSVCGIAVPLATQSVYHDVRFSWEIVDSNVIILNQL